MNERIEQLSREVEELKTLVHQLQGQLAAQPATAAGAAPAASPQAPPVSTAAAPHAGVAPALPGSLPPPAGPVSAAAGAGPVAANTAPPASQGMVADLLHGFTINALLDGYYEYNTNDPIGRGKPPARLRCEQQQFQSQPSGSPSWRALPIRRTASARACASTCNSVKRRRPCRAIPPISYC